ncbi:serine hydrolase domain-containing protein [Virgibacillus ndiopensis]|uniref:serine hydrolase domain-containing protein n=1 Tax=Virgibacillus ndiopensis TaxID=2004408 RepID=UPI000C07A2C3|nr:serine hydrolase domain-containing protein [Virgibacillus ndiopensis]
MRNKFILTVVFVIILFFFISEKEKSYAHPVVLTPGDAESVQMLQQPLNDIDESIKEAMANKVMPGAVALIARNGTIVKQTAYGYALRYADSEFNEVENPVEMENDTIFDLASISKLFTVTAAMQLYEEGKFELDDPVAEHIPQFAENGKEDVTIRQLMTHTTGFKAWIPLYNMADTREEALEIVLTYPLENEPGTTYEYSDLNMITLAALVEKWSGQRLDEYVAENITGPLGMEDTLYNPPASLIDRIAATAYVPGRGMIRGVVHDGNALVLDGVAGHAGVFSNADDLAIFAQMMLNKGIYQDVRVLEEETVDLITTNHTPEFPGNDHGLGWEINQDWFMSGMASTTTIGHTGFTGTSIVVSKNKDTIAILLTNRVHPTANTPSTNPIRREVAQKTSDAINAWSARTLAFLVEDFKNVGELSPEVAHSLKMHLTAVNQFEKRNMPEKVLKHMDGFKLMLNQKIEDGLIRDEIYKTLTRDADYLIGKWQ